MEVRLLGPVELWTDAGPLDAGPPRQRAVLAALALDAGRPVLADVLIDRVWGEAAPPRARQALHSYITRIRRALADPDAGTAPRLPFRSGGYVLECDRDRVDVHRFRALAGGPPERRADRLRQALDLWRGTPLADVAGPWAARVREGLHREHVDAVLAWAETELHAGNAAVTVPALSDLADQHPLCEPVTALLMRALHAVGRGADALHRYAAIAQRLAEELGADPAPQLQAVHRAILRGEMDHRPAPEPPAPAAASAAVPALLPPDAYGFIGRRAQLDHLDAVLTRAADQPTATAVALVTGPAGVGKTALAVHWAHRVRDRFPDGQLAIDLRGFAPGGPAVTPAEAVRRFLDALNVPRRRVPAALDAQLDLYRTELARRRVLVLLDNARDEAQVRPLLPGGPGSAVVLTSRHRLPGLVAAHGAEPVIVDLLSAPESRDLLTRRVGANRAGAEPGAVDRIVRRCARLPLALSIVAARAAHLPDFPLSVFADELDGLDAGLDPLSGEDAVTDVRAVFSSSYRALDPEAAGLFRLLGVWPGPELTVAAAASLTALPRDRARRLVATLAQAHLLTEHAAGRYAMHDLLAAYATELARRHLSAEERQAARCRVLDHYLHTAYAAAAVLNPHREQVPIGPPEPGSVAEEITGIDAAFAWFTAAYPALAAAVGRAAAAGLDGRVVPLARAVEIFLHRRGRWPEQLDVQRAGLGAAQRLGDLGAQSRAHMALGLVHTALGDYDEATDDYERAVAFFARSGDGMGQVNAHRGMSWLCERAGRPADALNHALRAVEVAQAYEFDDGQAEALNQVGWCAAMMGDHERAVAYCERALELNQRIGNVSGESNAWDSIGYAFHHLGRHAEAVPRFERALALTRRLGARLDEAEVLDHLGDAYAALNRSTEARAAWRQALAILDEWADPDAARVRAKL
ncbi:SARP family transcriptional regulator [Sphaerisporangium krabiense]|uniref:DNA-binding SARP family transcriptional activator/tetratricopeptide (TPR) repeat protein n=1 Tax=Sphaerisporangium krabiense TaxID=763782 RepID=A0A7W9DMQ0_9ACTN|nr:BTAD domain-containing putative transcriptional regulator [Sphaerisporangium krabiense]MBB5624592.1 DNA-binding SARP family transcriptional activator/tetratricopeptide (TPR) repeat protein [Sphaerisporangium krabiense]GII61455.1 SARP family transcriptional regulator [Sphaerisporangium krabiense]